MTYLNCLLEASRKDLAEVAEYMLHIHVYGNKHQIAQRIESHVKKNIHNVISRLPGNELTRLSYYYEHPDTPFLLKELIDFPCIFALHIIGRVPSSKIEFMDMDIQEMAIAEDLKELIKNVIPSILKKRRKCRLDVYDRFFYGLLNFYGLCSVQTIYLSLASLSEEEGFTLKEIEVCQNMLLDDCLADTIGVSIEDELFIQKPYTDIDYIIDYRNYLLEEIDPEFKLIPFDKNQIFASFDEMGHYVPMLYKPEGRALYNFMKKHCSGHLTEETILITIGWLGELVQENEESGQKSILSMVTSICNHSDMGTKKEVQEFFTIVSNYLSVIPVHALFGVSAEFNLKERDSASAVQKRPKEPKITVSESFEQLENMGIFGEMDSFTSRKVTQAINNSADKEILCPCGSGKPWNKCHGRES